MREERGWWWQEFIFPSGMAVPDALSILSFIEGFPCITTPLLLHRKTDRQTHRHTHSPCPVLRLLPLPCHITTRGTN